MAVKLMTCNACRKMFRLDIAEEEEEIACPKCESLDVHGAYAFLR
jgi:DNA-directed RNA polymerase subunit RPC12/RpoP